MSTRLNSPRLLSCLLAGSLALSCLSAEPPPRYPELDDPFGPPPGPPPQMQADMPPHGQLPPPPLREQPGERIDAGELLTELEDSGVAYDDPESKVTLEQLHALERFLCMPPEQLARIRQTIERVEGMSEEEKEALKAKIAAFRKLEEEKIDKLRKMHNLWRGVPREQRMLVHRYMMSLPMEEANAIRKQCMQFEEQQFEACFQELVAKAEAADAAGELPSLPESVRRWRRDRDPDSKDHRHPDQLNAIRKRDGG